MLLKVLMSTPLGDTTNVNMYNMALSGSCSSGKQAVDGGILDDDDDD